MKKGIYLLGAVILTISMMMSFAMGINADPTDPTDPTEATDCTITFTAGENGTLTGEKSFTVAKDSAWSGIVVPTPTPDAGYTFKSWSPELPEGTATITESASYTAVFEKDESQWVTITFVAGENGTLEGKTTFEVLKGSTWKGTITTPTAKANEGYVFSTWKPLIPLTSTITESATYTATFIATSTWEEPISKTISEIESYLKTTTTTAPPSTEAPATQAPAAVVTTTKKSKTKKTTKSVATTLSEAEITTVQVAEEEKVSSLGNEQAGISVYPDRAGGASFSSSSQLTVLGVDKTGNEYKKIVDAAGTTEFILLYDVSVSNYNGSKIKVAFKVGEEYKGQIVTVLYNKDSRIEKIVTKVSEQGLVVIEVETLATFAIMLGQPVVAVAADQNIMEKISDTTGLSQLAIILIFSAIIVLMAIISIIIIINADRKKKWKEAQGGEGADLSILQRDFGYEEEPKPDDFVKEQEEKTEEYTEDSFKDYEEFEEKPKQDFEEEFEDFSTIYEDTDEEHKEE